MQQAIVAARRASESTTSASGNAFVINLVSSTTPVALIRPDHAGLNRFTFFVSRRREDGRERFRLHMGYFDSQEEAEKLLDIVRGIYPGAWAGLAPGRRLAAASTTVAPSASAAAAVPPATAPPVAAVAVPPAPAPLITAVAAPPAAVPAVSVQVVQPAPAPTSARAPESASSPAPEVTAAAAAPQVQDRQATARALSNIREAIASLSDSATIPVLRAATTVQSRPAAVPPAAVPTVMAPTVMAPTVMAPTVRVRGPMPAAAKVPPQKVAPQKPSLQKPSPPKAPSAPMPAATAPAAAAELSDTGTLRLLEGSAQSSTAAGSTAAASTAAAPPPREERPCYAVQLMWSVQPIAMTQVPQLAIFSAYTLYGAEGNRDGRRWYGLRLGFFTDAVSAKQVAHYVRADFSTVSVVPVTVREREQARLASARATGTAVKSAAEAGKASNASGRTATGAAGGNGTKTRISEFELIDDKESLTIKTAKPGGVVQLRPGVPVRATRGAPGKRAKQRPPGQLHARSRTRPMTLEETLEILGAGQLQMDNEPGLPAKDPDKHTRLDTARSRPSKLSRLFERLSDRLGN